MENRGKLLLAIVVGALLLSTASILVQSGAQAAGPATPLTDVRRKFYLTKGAFSGGQALTACATGYHMASIWEIKETTMLRYVQSLGRTNGDSSIGGPPSSYNADLTLGWIRVGSTAQNCKQWTSSSPSDSGTYGTLAVGTDLEPVWVLQVIPNQMLCDGTISGTQEKPGVWCVQD